MSIMADPMRALGITPTSDRITRERTYPVCQLREDGKDVQGQLAIILTQLRDEKFTGHVTINISEGGIQHIKATQSQKIPTGD